MTFSSLLMGTNIIVTGFEDETMDEIEEEVLDMDVRTESSPTIASTNRARTVSMT